MSDEIDVHPVTDACWDVGRPKSLNASEIACKFGMHEHRTLASVIEEKRNGINTGPDPEAELIVRGHALEDDALDAIQKLRPNWQISLNTNHYVDRKHRMAAIPDALVIDPARPGVGSLQLKVVSAPVFRKKWDDGEIVPTGHLLQLSQEMMLIPGCTWGAIGALVIGDFRYKGFVFPIERNRRAEIRLRTAAAEFWEAFDRGDMPAIDFERDGALIELMFPTATPGKVVDLSRDNQIGDLLERREILKSTAADVEKRLKATDAEIKLKLGDAEAALVRGWRVTFKTQHRKEYMVKATSFRMLRTDREKEIEHA